MEKEIDRLLRLLKGDTHGRLLMQIVYDYKIDRSVIKEAKCSGYIDLYNEEKREYTDVLDDRYFCRITNQGSQLLNQEGGLKQYIDHHRMSWIISIIVAIITFCSLVISLLQ